MRVGKSKMKEFEFMHWYKKSHVNQSTIKALYMITNRVDFLKQQQQHNLDLLNLIWDEQSADNALSYTLKICPSMHPIEFFKPTLVDLELHISQHLVNHVMELDLELRL